MNQRGFINFAAIQKQIYNLFIENEISHLIKLTCHVKVIIILSNFFKGKELENFIFDHKPIHVYKCSL